MNAIPASPKSSRLLSLDILRGITIAGMIMVNNPGSWSYAYAPLRHAHWHGLTPTDLVFPFFMFIMGVSTFLSLRKFNFEPSKAAVRKVVRRTILIFVIGVALGWFGQLTGGLASGESFGVAATHFDTLRILGVLQRLALAYGFAALIVLFIKTKYLPWIIGLLLLGYFLILRLGKGFEMSEENIIAVVDKSIMGAAHMYKDTTPEGVRLAFDPEGLLSTIPSIAHVLIGFLFGKMIVENKENQAADMGHHTGFLRPAAAIRMSHQQENMEPHVRAHHHRLCGTAAGTADLDHRYPQKRAMEPLLPRLRGESAHHLRVCRRFGQPGLQHPV